MGRFAGNIALDAGIACGAEYILVPEVPFSREKLARSLIGQMKEGRTNSIIICAEGADDGRALGDWLKEYRYLHHHSGIYPKRRTSQRQRQHPRLPPRCGSRESPLRRTNHFPYWNE